MTEPTYTYRPTPDAALLAAILDIGLGTRAAAREAVAAWEQWTEARSFVEHTAAVVRLDAAMTALREVAT